MDALPAVDFALCVALTCLVGAITGRISQLRREVKGLAFAAEDVARLGSRIEELVDERLEGKINAVIDERSGRVAALREELRRSVRKEAQKALEEPEFQAVLDRFITDKLTRGAFNDSVKRVIDGQFRLLAQYVEEEVAPKAVRKAAATGRLMVQPIEAETLLP